MVHNIKSFPKIKENCTCQLLAIDGSEPCVYQPCKGCVARVPGAEARLVGVQKLPLIQVPVEVTVDVALKRFGEDR